MNESLRLFGQVGAIVILVEEIKNVRLETRGEFAPFVQKTHPNLIVVNALTVLKKEKQLFDYYDNKGRMNTYAKIVESVPEVSMFGYVLLVSLNGIAGD